MSLPLGTIGLVGGGTKSWKVSFNAKQSSVSIGYGTMFYNGHFFTTNDIEENKITSGIGKDNTVPGISIAGGYIYLYILNPTSLPTETTDSIKIKIGIATSFEAPNTKNSNTPLTDWIPLAYIDTNGKVFDLRPTFIINSFSFLA